MQEMINDAAIQDYLRDLQNRICKSMEQEDHKKQFLIDDWHTAKGWGSTRLLEDGGAIERGGANFSCVEGDRLPPAATLKRPELTGGAFKAMGVSAVMHPINPFVPTSHLNVRFFRGRTPEGKSVWWFGGGFDLTPYYPFLEDCVYWHQMAEQACRSFGAEIYPRYKKECDDYFYLPHRKETRGIGGLFFDDLNEWSFERCFEFMRSIGDHFLLAYQTLLAKRKDHPFNETHVAFQRYRRGRYVEFNLVYDRGTLFGLQYGGRIESILMSLPRRAEWCYQATPQPNTPEANLEAYLKPTNWLNLKEEKAPDQNVFIPETEEG